MCTNKIFRTIIVAGLVLYGCTAFSVGQTPAISAGRLQCEYRVNPEGIDVVSPRLSWVVSSAQRGQRQTAYRILVASDPAILAAHRGDVWDSGKVTSDQTLHVPYQGATLTSYQRCWWKVRVWDNGGQPSDWSASGYWSMGILSARQWAGQWLGYSQPYSTPEELAIKGSWKQAAPSPLFRKQFTLGKDVRHAALYISGLGFYEAYLNGAKVGDHVLDPAFTRYDRACLYAAYDVTAQVNKGDNAIGVMLGNGWYNMFSRAAWNFDRAPWRDQPKMLAQLRVEYADGTTAYIVSDESWKASTGPVVLDGIRQGEVYDARREKDGWATVGYDDSGWSNPSVVSPPKGTLRAQMTPPIRVTETLLAAKRTQPRPGVFVFDLGQNIAGWAQLKVSGPAGTKVQLRYGERLNSDGTVDQRDIKTHTYEEVFHTDVYILKGQGQEVWEPRFAYYGFQYVEVTGYPGTPPMDAIVGRVVNTDFAQTGRFRSSSELLNQMHHCILWAYRGNYVGYPMDCPHREKNGWTGDAHLAVEQAMYNWAAGGAYTKWLEDIKDEQRESGELPGIVPTGGWGYHWGNGPAWDSAYLIIPWEMYRYYGDKRILETHFDRFKRYVDYLTSRADNHIINFGLNDWAPADTTTPTDITSTAFYYLDVMITANAADVLGHADDARIYRALADQIKQAFHKHFYKGDGVYSVGSQTALSFPLYCGLVPESERANVMAKLLDAIRVRGNHIDTGILGAKAIFNVLSENGAHETAYRMITNPTEPSYAYWMQQGATTFWEFWSGAESQNHIMYGDIGAWFYKNLAGINLDMQTPEHTAFKHFILRPRLLDDLTEVDVSYESMRGTIGSAWTISGDSFVWSVRVPANTTATIYVPATEAAVVKESGSPAAGAEGVTAVNYEDGYSIYTLQSGSYRFTSQIAPAKWSKTVWTNDEDSGISAGKVYTHAVNLSADPAQAVTVNGVSFESGHGRTGREWSISGTPLANRTASTGRITGDGAVLVSRFVSSEPAELMLTGLTPGQDYVLTHYTRGWGSAGQRRVGITTSVDGVTAVLDQNVFGDGVGCLWRYAYTAPATGQLKLSFQTVTGGDNTWHHYAFSNEVKSPVYLHPSPLPGGVVDRETELRWSLRGDIVTPTYDVLVATDAAMSRRVVDQRGLTRPVFITPLAPETDYYWQVKAVNGEGTSVYTGPVWHFKTLPPPPDAVKVLEWKFNETKGAVVRQTGPAAGGDGLLKGVHDPDAPQIRVAGVDGNALLLTGSDHYVDVSGAHAAMPFASGQSFSISGYFRTTGQYGPVFSMRKSGNETPIIDIALGADGVQNSPGQLCVLVRDNSGSMSNMRSGVAVNDGRWHHFAVSRNNDKWILHIDGIACATMMDMATGAMTLDWLSIGTSIEWITSNWQPHNKHYRFFEGAVDDYTVWKGALQPHQIAELAARVPH